MSQSELKVFIDAAGPDPSFASLITPSPNTSQTFFNFNNDEAFNMEENMLEFDLEDLETLLDVNNVPVYSPMDIGTELHITPSKLEAMLNNNNLLEDTVEVKDELKIAPGYFYDGTGWVLGPQEVPVVQQPVQPSQDKNFLLIKIPEDLQASDAFDTLPTIQLKPNTVKEINKASTGHDGVYLSTPNDISGLVPKKTVNIIRRKPLQVIQTVVPMMVKLEPIADENVKVNKRKQQFNLTREDGVMFLSDSPEPREKRPRDNDDHEWFVTLVPKVAADGSQVEADDSNRCQGCNKVFKNLAKHKCKKLEGADEVGKEPMICASCNKKYKTKKGLIKHFTKCDQSKVFQDKPYENSDTEDAMEDFMNEIGDATPVKEPAEDEEMPMDALDEFMEQEFKKQEELEKRQNARIDAQIQAHIFKIQIQAMKKVKKSKRPTKKVNKKAGNDGNSTPKKPLSAKKATPKLPRIEKPSTRLSTKKVKMLTRSAKKKQV